MKITKARIFEDTPNLQKPIYNIHKEIKLSQNHVLNITNIHNQIVLSNKLTAEKLLVLTDLHITNQLSLLLH